MVEENLDECVLCELCVQAAPAGGRLVVVKLYDGTVLERSRRKYITPLGSFFFFFLKKNLGTSPRVITYSSMSRWRPAVEHTPRLVPSCL